MAWNVVENGGDCGDDTPWAVVNTDTDATEGCFATEEEAQAEADRLQEAADAETDVGTDTASSSDRFDLVLTIEGEQTTDGREIAPGALTTRELPIPLMLLTETGWGHEGARIAGVIDTLTLEGSEWRGSGRYDLGGESGQECQRLVNDQVIRWVSADLEVLAAEYILVDADGNDSDIPLEDLWELPDGYRVIERVTEGRIMGATACPFPAFPGAVIVPAGMTIEEATENGRAAAIGLAELARREGHAVRASALIAGGSPITPPAVWFEDPHLDAPTPITITDDGRVFGHIATWGTCHTGREDVCLTAPRSRSGYAYFRTGAVRTLEGREIPVGHLTYATGHASLRASHHEAAAHYDHTGTAWADVAAGEDEHGAWIAGAVRPGVLADDDQLRTLRASAVSGDWRAIGGALELVAVLSVNVPGFPVPRTMGGTLAASGQVSLVAAGVVRNDPVRDRFEHTEEAVAKLHRRLDSLEVALLPELTEKAAARVASLVPRP